MDETKIKQHLHDLLTLDYLSALACDYYYCVPFAVINKMKNIYTMPTTNAGIYIHSEKKERNNSLVIAK